MSAASRAPLPQPESLADHRAELGLSNSDVEIIEASTDALMMEVQSIRWDVFVEEQQVPMILEIDARDYREDVTQLLAIRRRPSQNEAEEADAVEYLGCVRIIPDGGNYYHLGRLAVRKEARGQRVGEALVTAVHQHVALRSPLGRWGCVTLDAQLQAKPFYERLGYRETSGEIFLDAGIEHCEMAVVVQGFAENPSN